MSSPWRRSLQARSGKVLCPHSPQTLDVRLGFSLCSAELEFLQKRRLVVAEALKQVLQLEEDLQEDEVGMQRTCQPALGARPEPSLSFQHGCTSCS